MESDRPYWMALGHATSFINRRKLQFLSEVVLDKMTVQESLQRIRAGDRLGFDFTQKEWEGLQKEVEKLPNYAFLAEELEEKGIHFITILDKYVYPETLKRNLTEVAPVIIYAKGNLDLIKKPSIAIVGARQCGTQALEFTDNVARSSVKKGKLVVSGFAKGVDKEALDAALRYKGQSIIVLPQGIDTYKSKAYYADIVSGNVLVISAYHPKTPWSVGLAMDRNKTIYALAEEIYAAESNDSGGTWQGVLDGLKRGRRIFVRKPEEGEKNANSKLIEKGAVPVDMFGSVLDPRQPSLVTEETASYSGSTQVDSESALVDAVVEQLQKRKGKGLTITNIKELLDLEESLEKKLTIILDKSTKLQKQKKGRLNLYKLPADPLPTLF